MNNRLSEVISADLPEFDHFLQFNDPALFNPNVDKSKFRFILNIRDPRDKICNGYHWALIHPTSGKETEEETLNRRQLMIDKGIDSWVLSQLGTTYFDNLFQAFDISTSADIEVLSYARLCLDFDSFINKFCDFMEIKVTDELLALLSNERVDNLAENDQWIGNKWQGSDVYPGRYKSELRRETIELINQKLSPVLHKMAEIDPDFSDLYLEGVK
ncbi:sulfotransferase domain-containing protein [Psychromonas hadalis]|uniref:sulfotransferase domain-containing protein n=1 Tax=Psychromonas hadalis TaxID=211669 RepID=UPI00146C277F|nr:sulfotransferase domain-containing protein [Psychromonas hadalis]